jgi:CRP/FNR family transcriptional regulator
MNSTDPLLHQLRFFPEPEFRDELLMHGQVVSFKKGDVIVKDGQYVKFLPIVLKGAIRVYQQKEDREILLYYVKAEETCTMSLAAAYFNNKSSSHGVVTEPTDVLIFPADLVHSWQLKYPSWNKYVMHMFRSRYDQLISSFEGMAFDHIPDRVLAYLQQKKATEENTVIHISHQQLAKELGTTRVVISRILKQFEKEKKLKLSRGSIELASVSRES